MSSTQTLGLLWFALTSAVALLMWAAQVPPDQAVSNLYAWLRRAGIEHPPEWLRDRVADRKVRRGASMALLLLALWGGMLIESWIRGPSALTARPPLEIPAGPKRGPIGPILAVELVQLFQSAPKQQPCMARITAPDDNKDLRDTLRWILEYGAHCGVDSFIGVPNADKPNDLDVFNKKSGIIIHYQQRDDFGQQVAHFFDAAGFKTSMSYRLPDRIERGNDPPTKFSVWIDIGPGAPWK